MPPPSPTRKEQLLAWDKASLATLKAEAQHRHSSMQTAPAESERKQTTTATYTEQYLKRRRSQQGLTDSASPKTNGNRRIERRRSSEDLGTSSDLFNGPRPLHQENGHHGEGLSVEAPRFATKSPGLQFVADVDTAVASENVVAADSGTGIPTCGTIDAVSKVTMTKKRKRSTVVMTLAAGVLTVTIVGGFAVCQMYPSCPAAEWIGCVPSRMEDVVYTLLIVMRKGMVAYVDMVRTKCMALLQSRAIQETARATEELVSTAFVTMVMESLRHLLRLSVSAMVDTLKLSVEWMQSHLRTVFEQIELELVFERARSIMLIVLSSLAETLKEWTELSLDQVFEWAGLKSNASDVNLPSDHFLAPLATHQAAIQNFGRVLTAQESQALQNVKRFEKRRVTIVSDTNSIIADTRAIALESVVDVKMAALEFIEMRLKILEEQYARVFDQALKDYERTSQQVEKEGGVGILSEIEVENQAPVDVAATFSRSLTPHEKTADDKPKEPTGFENQDLSKDESSEESPIDHQTHVQLVKEEKLLEDTAEVSSPGGGIKDEDQPVAELTEEDVLTVELMETQAIEHSSSEKAMESDHVEEQIGIAADLTEKDRLIIELPVPVVEIPRSLEDDGGQITAQLAGEKLLTIELESTDKEEVLGTAKEAYVTEVMMDFDNGVLEIEHTEQKVTELLETQNQSKVDTSEQKVDHQLEERVEAHFRVPVDGTDVDLAVKLGNHAGENTELVEKLLPEVRTRVAVQPKNDEKNGVDSQKIYKTELMQEDVHSRMHQEILLADEMEIEVQSERLHAETIVIVENDADEAAKVVFADVQRVEEEELVRLREPATEKNVQESDAASGDDDLQESTRNLYLEKEINAASLSETGTLGNERVVVAKEIQELEQLEQVLLQEEGEPVRVQEELRAIAEEEDIWLHSDHAPAEGKVAQDEAVPGQHITATNDMTEKPEVAVDSRSDDWRSSLDSPASALPSSALKQVGFLSVVFLSFAMLTVYLLARHRKWSLLARAPRRHRRWKRLADMNESDTEEVVLLPDDSSDEEDGTDVAIPKESHLEVVELMSSVDVKTTAMLSSEGEGVGEEEETNEDHEAGEEKDVEESDFVITRSRSAIEECAQTATNTVDHPATPNSDTSGERIDTAITTPPVSRLNTPDTSQRMTRRQRQKIST